MPSFNQKTFFADFTARTGLNLTPKRKAALDFLLIALQKDAGFTMIREIAYVLATVQWETAHTFEPIAERRANPNTNPKLWDVQNRYWKTGFYGRGYVQITWEDNYRNAGQKLKGTTVSSNGQSLTINEQTFLDSPALVMEPPIAYLIAARGMREGWFTKGKRKLSDYIKEGVAPDYVNARRIINGTDKAQEIATIAEKFELLLRASA